MFSHSPSEWRFLNVEPLEFRFTNKGTPVVAKVVFMNDLKDGIITNKIMQLIDLELVTVIEPSIKDITNIRYAFLVKHNSKAGAQWIKKAFERMSRSAKNLDRHIVMEVFKTK